MKLIEEIIKSFIILFVIMDPFASLPVFISITRGFKPQNVAKSANKAVLVAGALAVLFILLGKPILDVLRISVSDIQIAGGIILGIMGLDLVLGISLVKERVKDYNVAAVVIGTPLLTGPGVIAASILLVQEQGFLAPLVAAVISLFFIWIVLRNAHRLQKFFGINFIDVVSRIMGILLTAIAIGFIRAGVTG
jgi:multiple antibiotic resistance protein